MRKSFPFAVLATLSLAMATPAAIAADAEIGAPAPAFSLTGLDGQTHDLSDFAGKTVVLEWTNHECPFVVKHYDGGNIPRQQATATAAGVVWIVINSSAPGKQGHVNADEARRIQADWNAGQTHYLFDGDGAVGRAYGAKTTPHMYVIDPDGVLRYNGAIDSIPSAKIADLDAAEQFVELALAELAARQPVSRPLTQPYGCSVKY
ncbi:thioredoxin family protein [Wenzhouxiangella sp. XN24]|uniref:thioredoxin family protein n=1 Tax=Wenzhouxiangella sp. XN24 TaxID=2713569 RepID=UPI0013EB3F48|nr:thioredoxin family protein [Wenzhouxiangella sp. XN24]NGX17318.1 thioredoxin family protein [Wenzhouxiangella sp. XN24]